jgi:hypothetical protein
LQVGARDAGKLGMIEQFGWHEKARLAGSNGLKFIEQSITRDCI